MHRPRCTPDAVRAALGSSEHVELLAITDENDTWAVGRSLVAKFVSEQAHAWKVPLEIAAFPLIADRLGDIVPRIVDNGEADGLPWVLYERVEGRPGQTPDGRTARTGPGLATSVASVLASVHAVAEADARAVGIGDRPLSFSPLTLARSTREVVAEVIGHPRLEAFLDAEPPAPVDRVAFCHTDVKGEHLFLDDGGSRVRHVIDWADAEICDPAKDYADVTMWLGPSFTRAVVAAGDEDDGTLADRAIWLCRTGMLDYWNNVLAGTETGPLPLLRAQLRAAFSD